MRKFLVLFVLCCITTTTLLAKTNFMKSDLFAGMKSGDKAAILMVHFGTTHSDTREKSIDALNKLVSDHYPQLEQREAWTSRMILRILRQRGEVIDTPYEALERLKAEGYTHIIIQSSNIIEGVEMESLRRDVLAMKDAFTDIRIGNPLLYTTEDYEVVADVIKDLQPKGSSVVLVGHGTYTPATAQYSMFDYVVRDKGYKGIHMGTIEGYPTYDTMLKSLGRDRAKNVLLMPFMFVAGEHAKNDIAEDWNNLLTEQGYKVTLMMKGLGEHKKVQELFVEHIKFSTQHKMYDIMEKKEGYVEGKTFN